MSNDADANFWLSTIDAPSVPRPPLGTNQQVDVVIIGAGFTGLWTAYYLKTQAPDLEVIVLEAERVGHGASGRNGGWVVGGIAGLQRHIGDLPREQRERCCQILADNVDHVGATLATEGISADYNKGGVIYAAARYRDQIAVQRHYLEHLHDLGYSEADCCWLDAEQLAAKARFRDGYGGIFHRQVATINPAKTVHGLAAVVEGLGVMIHENSRATSLQQHVVGVAGGNSVEARTVVCATEGYADDFLDFKRHVIPVQSLIVATEPLSDALWEEIGMAERPAFADASRLVNYGHRSADGRMVFGARGDYRFGAKSKPELAIDDAAIRMRRNLLADLFPPLTGVKIDYGWGGSLGLSRNFCPHAIIDRGTGLATAGGYAGEGVAASHLFARTLADLILERESELAAMPWAFEHTSHRELVKRWEPEPLRWLAAQTISCCYAGEEALMLGGRRIPVIKPALQRLNNAFASMIE